MGFRISRGIFKVLDQATNTYKEKFKIDELSGEFVKLDDAGNAVADAVTTAGGTITGPFHTTHTSNTYTGAHATLGSYYINDTNTNARLKRIFGAGSSVNVTLKQIVKYKTFDTDLTESDKAEYVFKKQIEKGGPLTVTHEDVTRFFMTIPEAAQLVIQAGSMSKGGDVFVLDMGEPVKILDLAKKMIHLSGLSVKDINNFFMTLKFH